LVRIPLLLTSGLCALALVGSASGTPTATRTCKGSISGLVRGNLVVSAGTSCRTRNVNVQGHVFVRRNATLNAPGVFRVRGNVDVARGATLQVTGPLIAVGGQVLAQGAKKVALIRQPAAGSSGTIARNVSLFDTADITVLALTIGGEVSLRGGGGEGVDVGATRILRSLEISGMRMLHPQRPRAFSVHSNSVGHQLTVSDNDATGAISPLFIGGNTVVKGHLVCDGNVPEPVNTGPGGVAPNVVLHGKKRGQCKSL
jgi:hypothetical protein